jgi:large subunit ribosomal protein L32
MPNPKRQHSKQRSRKRRGGHPKLQAARLSPCSHCGKPVLSHRVCPFCGFYKGKQIIEIVQEVEETKQ